MKVDFFDEKYKKEPSRTDKIFGINDSSSSAYTTLKGSCEQWNVIVYNSNGLEIQFVAVDNNIIVKDSQGNIQSQCDGMLYHEKNWLAFVELKNIGKRPWINSAANQLESTINIFSANHNYKQFLQRFAYISNKQHPKFQFSKKELMLKFFQKTKFRLRIQNEISVL